MPEVKVSVRVRPTANFAQDQLRIDQDTNSIFVNLSGGHGEDDEHDSHYSANKADSFNFSYHHVLHNAGQESVYESNTSKVVDGVMNGRNGTVLAYVSIYMNKKNINPTQNIQTQTYIHIYIVFFKYNFQLSNKMNTTYNNNNNTGTNWCW